MSRWLVCAAALSAACSENPAPTRPAVPAPAGLVSTTTFDDAGEHLRVTGVKVDLARLPLATWIGLPMSGVGDIDVDVRVPLADGALDWRGATGHVNLTCAPCALGDGRAKLKPKLRARAAAELVGDGITFGRVALDEAHVALVLGQGEARITEWRVASHDVAIELALRVQLAAALDDSAVAGCLRFRALDELARRDRPTADVIAVAGGPLGQDGMIHIRLGGTVGAGTRLGQVCDGTAPPVAEAPPTVRDAGSGSDAAAAEPDEDLPAQIARDVHPDGPDRVTVERALLDRLLANPVVMAKGVRVVPAVKNGQPAGFKLYAIRPGSVFAALGFMNGDTVLAVNGHDLSSADRALEVYTSLRDASALDIAMERRGKPLTLHITIR